MSEQDKCPRCGAETYPNTGGFRCFSGPMRGKAETFVQSEICRIRELETENKALREKLAVHEKCFIDGCDNKRVPDGNVCEMHAQAYGCKTVVRPI